MPRVPDLPRATTVFHMHASILRLATVALGLAGTALAQSGSFINWESPQAHPVDVTPDGRLLLVANTADARLEVFDVSGKAPVRLGSVPVGLDPVSVRARGNGEAWVVNQISDSVSIVDLASLRVRRTVLVGDEPADVVFAGTPQRAQLLREWDRALVRTIGDGQLSRLDRVMAVNARIDLAKVDAPGEPLPVALQTEIRGTVLSTLREVRDPFEREALSVAAASALADAGLWSEAENVAKTQMERSSTPYYHMRVLAALARERGDFAAAIGWSEKAYASAKGPATRLEWGAGLLRNLINHAPAEAGRIERTAASVIGELEPRPETFHGRNRGILERMGRQLNEWNKDGSQAAVLQRLKRQLDGVCAAVDSADGQRAACEAVLKPRG